MTAEMPKTLFEALARFQMDLPKIAKGETANVPTKQGGSYSYKYADLTDVSAAVLPKLGALGVAFIARPTTADGKFGLAYSLVHVSGDREDGFYEMNIGGMTPQQIGGMITYARRYCLCAATGIAPGGDDDDAQAANQFAAHRQSATDAWESAAPARPNGNGNGNGRRNEPARAAAADGEVDIDAQAFADEAHDAVTLHDIEDIHRRAREAQKLTALVRNPSTDGKGKPGKLAIYLDWKRKQIRELDEALADLTKTASETGFPVEELETHVKSVTGTDLEVANTAQIRHATQVLRTMQEAAA